VHMPLGARFEQTLPAGHNAFVYVYRGEVRIGGRAVPLQRMAILANTAQADGVVIEASADAQVILVAGQPLREPIVQYGPFVMNTKEEIVQALADFREGRLGERA
jgi:redox-sensitive bicupin YhaK (pirin superfamily)